MSSKIRVNFYRELAKQDEQINLAYAALLFAELLTEAFDAALYLTLLDEIAEKLEKRIRTTRTTLEIIDALNNYLFTELKFSGNAKDYYQPYNSFLNKVLDLRTGIPISLSMVYLEVGWRLELPVWGVNLPGHFIVGYGSPEEPTYIDVFGQGRILSEDDCLTLAQGRVANHRQIREKYLKPISKKKILYRMLLNLKQIYVSIEHWQEAHAVVDLMLAVKPRRPSDIRDRGLLAARIDRLQEATRDLERYLFLVPNSPDSAWLKQHLENIEETLIRLN